MKRLISLAMMMLPMMAMAQLPTFSKIADKYDGNAEGMTSMVIGKPMLAMFADSDETYDFIDEIQILLSEDANTAKEILEDAQKAVKKSKLEMLVSANDDGATLTVYTKSEGGVLRHLVLVIENETPSGFIVISGNIPENKLNEIVKIVNM